jgi:hypothetical protein
VLFPRIASLVTTRRAVAGFAGKHRMSDLIVRQGPEGRGQTSAQPGRAGVSMEDESERRRCATRSANLDSFAPDHSAKEHQA